MEKERTTHENMYYIAGRSEGFFDIRLSTLEDAEPSEIESYNEGLLDGKEKRESLDKKGEVKRRINKIQYIKMMARDMALGKLRYNITNTMLSDENKEIFDIGFEEGERQVIDTLKPAKVQRR